MKAKPLAAIAVALAATLLMASGAAQAESLDDIADWFGYFYEFAISKVIQ